MAEPARKVSFGPGAGPSTFGDAGATVTVLCFTHGEASTANGVSMACQAMR